VLIAEMLLLVAVDDKGRVPIRRKASFTRRNAFMEVGLAGALLAELAVDGQLTIARRGPVRAAGTRPADELLAEVYDAVRNHLDGRKPRGAIDGLGRDIGGTWNRVVGRLVAAGVLGRDRPSVLRPAAHPVIDAAARQAVLEQVQAAAGVGPMRADAALVLALAGPCRLLEEVAPERGPARRQAIRRMSHATAEAPFAPDVATSVNELVAAVTETIQDMAWAYG
jgi:Golgi phosphoprotein 3 (GPP34)